MFLHCDLEKRKQKYDAKQCTLIDSALFYVPSFGLRETEVQPYLPVSL